MTREAEVRGRGWTQSWVTSLHKGSRGERSSGLTTQFVRPGLAEAKAQWRTDGERCKGRRRLRKEWGLDGSPHGLGGPRPGAWSHATRLPNTDDVQHIVDPLAGSTAIFLRFSRRKFLLDITEAALYPRVEHEGDVISKPTCRGLAKDLGFPTWYCEWVETRALSVRGAGSAWNAPG